MFRDQFAQCPATAPQLTEGVEYFSLGHRLAVGQMPHFVRNMFSTKLHSVKGCTTTKKIVEFDFKVLVVQ